MGTKRNGRTSETMHPRRRGLTSAAAMSVLMFASTMVVASEGRLTRAQAQECANCQVELQGFRREVDVTRADDVDWYNGRLEAWNSDCAGKACSGKPVGANDSRTTLLWARCKAALLALRAEKEGRMAHANTGEVQIYDRANGTRTVVGQLERWHTVETTGMREGDWSQVRWQTPGTADVIRYGWVLGGLLTKGDGAKERYAHCKAVEGSPPRQTEEIDRGRSGGEATLSVSNMTSSEACLKVLDSSAARVRTVYIPAQGTATLHGIPHGTMTIAYAKGREFSRGCDSFAMLEHAGMFDEPLHYDALTRGWTLTLHPVAEGNARTRHLEPEAFDLLRAGHLHRQRQARHDPRQSIMDGHERGRGTMSPSYSWWVSGCRTTTGATQASPPAMGSRSMGRRSSSPGNLLCGAVASCDASVLAVPYRERRVGGNHSGGIAGDLTSGNLDGEESIRGMKRRWQTPWSLTRASECRG